MAAMASLALVLVMGTTGGVHPRHNGARVVAPGPGAGWGFPNGNPDGYGYWDNGTALPLGANRTPEYYFPRYLAVPASQLFMPTYFNGYVTRGQRYISYTGCGGDHPAGGPAPVSARLPVHPVYENANKPPVVTPPRYSGRVGDAPINPGGSGLTP